MEQENMNRVQKLTCSAMVIALYVVVLYFTQSFSFGAYQIRIATSLYALSYLFPFLVLPLGLANFIANLLFGGLGILDMAGGFLVGILTASSIAAVRKYKAGKWMTALPILIFPGLGVPIWLSYCLNVPYGPLALSLCIGQIIPAIGGAALIQVLERIPGVRKTAYAMERRRDE